MSEEKLTEALYVRVAPGDIERLDALSERIAVVSKNAIARAAMRLGLSILENDPSKILGTVLRKRSRTRAR